MIFNRLTFMEDVGYYVTPKGHKSRLSKWLCACGVIKDIRFALVKNESIKSCGCYKKEFNRSQVFKHGLRDHELYDTWFAMIARCTNKNAENYHLYGGRGIKVCDKWMSLTNFIHDMHPKPGKKYQLDRKNNNGNYNQDNCRWVTGKVNARNRSNSKRWVINGVCFLASREAAKFLSVDKTTVIAWCDGKKIGGKYKKGKLGCYSYKIYGDKL